MAVTASPPGDIVLTVKDLRIVLDPSGIDIDDDVSFSVHQGEVLGLVGESASGKTTAATSLLAHQRRGARIAGGSVTVNGTDILTAGAGALRRIRGGLISYVPQDASAALNPALRIGTQLIEILEAHNFGSSRADREARRAEMLTEVLLPSDSDFIRRYPHQLSGGQQQRVAIAMAFACRPKVIVLDEPTTALDVTTQSHVLETIRDLTRSYGVSALYVTHDLAVVANLADRIAVMYAGRLVEIGPKEALFAGAWHPYTRKLLAAIPDLSGERALRGISGWAPRPGQRVAGCAFTPRCDMRIARCATDYPPYEGTTPDHQVRCWRWEELVDRPLEIGGPLREIVLQETTRQQPTVVSARGITAFYQKKEVLHGVSAELREHRCLALVGESGSGKTTLARCIAGLHPYRIDGDIELRGVPLQRESRGRSRAERQAIQYIFQSPYSSLNPRKTIRQLLAQPIDVFFDLGREEAEERMVRVLDQVALDDSLLTRYPEQLSGGERQRIAIARALAAEPTVLICDEVTSWLDVSVQAAIIELLASLQARLGVSMLFVTHNLALIRSIAQEVAVMSEGLFVEYGLVDTVLDDPQHDYTKKLLVDTPTLELAHLK
ncbi:MAG TPA: ABC transporter ATP-binding protein [Thermoleophilia bacterium]|nr:ABC transporter ATP-binding protein [Thermoleophilia bacterium]